MKEELLKQLIEKTFATIASPLQSNGVYAEIQKAITTAYNMGNKQEEHFGEQQLSIQQYQ